MKKPVVILSILLFFLAVLGPSYARWSGSVSLISEHQTGDWSLGIRCLDCSPSPRARPDDEGELVGYMDCVEGYYTGSLKGETYADSIRLSACGSLLYRPECTLEIANTGTVPAQIKNVWWDGIIGDVPLVWTVRFPKGRHAAGTGMESLQRALQKQILEPEQKIRVRMQFLFPGEEPEYAGGILYLDSGSWNINS